MRYILFISSVLLVPWTSGSTLPKSTTNYAECTNEQHRPRYHFSPAEHWLNDPNGMVYLDGIYHLFYQYHPYSSVWGPMHWGHAISSDMVHWKELGIALEPDEVGEIFSGSAVVDFKNSSGFQNDEVPPIVAIYTSAHQVGQRQSIAYSTDKGITFSKFEGNPVLADPSKPDFRDPKVHWNEEGNRWIMALAVRDRVEFFSSQDLKTWRKESEFGGEPEEGNHGGVWECPDVFPLKVKNAQGQEVLLWVLIVSINPGGPNRGSVAHYFVGDFHKNNEDRMVFESMPWKETQYMDWGPDNYAGVTFSNQPNNRLSYIGWMNNWLYANNLPMEKWRGQMTLPRDLGLLYVNDNQYRLTSTPSPELAILRNHNQHVEHSEPFELAPQNVRNLLEGADFVNPLMEMEITLEIENNPLIAICAFNADTSEESCFGYNATRWYLDRSKSGNTGFHGEFAATLVGYAAREVQSKEVTIRLFLDVSSLEAFTDQGLTSMTALHYPSQPFNSFYVNHWSERDSNARVNVLSYKIWGLDCWFSA